MVVLTDKIHVLDEAFPPPSYQNGYDHHTFHCRDIPRGAPTHKFAWHFNTFTLNHVYLRHNRENLMLSLQMQSSEKPKTF